MAQYNVTLTPMLRGKIIVAQSSDEGVTNIKRRLAEGDPKVDCFLMDEEGTLWFKDRLGFQRTMSCAKKIFDEAHNSKYSIHPGSTKMHHDLKAQFRWTRMKHETARYVVECNTCQCIKTDHMRPVGLLQPLNIRAWKWEDISMDFIMGLSPSARKFDSIWVLVDWFTKSSHFIPVHTNYRAEKYTNCILLASCVCMVCSGPSFLTEGSSLSLISGSTCTLP
jgi:hypothetical protein